MKILVDGIVFQNDYQRGIQRYFREVLQRIGKVHDVTIWTEFPSVSSMPENCSRMGPDLSRPPRRRNLLVRAKRELIRKLRSTRKSAFDVFCSSYYTSSPFPDLPAVVVVHDMIYEQFAFLKPDGDTFIGRKRDNILAARICLAISQETANQLKAFYPEVAGRTRVIHHGAEHLLAVGNGREAPGADVPDGMFVLFVGTRGDYKNFQLVVEAMNEPAWPAQVKLAIVGKPLTLGESLLINRLGLAKRVISVGEISDHALAQLYAGSIGFVFPSLQEGFGFPSLEAQSCGTPVACSDIPIFHEICGDGALYFDPRMPASLARTVDILTGSPVRDRLRELGKANIQRFSWERCARQTLGALEEAAAPRERPALAGSLVDTR